MTERRLFRVERPHLEVLDFDKTIADTRHLQRILEADIELHGIDSDRLRITREATSGFDTVKYLREVAGADDEKLADIKDVFFRAIEREGRDTFYMPEAQKMLDIIDGIGATALILTTGGGEWQRWKIEALGLLDRPYHVTSGRQKALLIAQGFNPGTGLYEFDDVTNLPAGATGYEFANFRLVDDNIQAFDSMPADAHGYHIVTDELAWRRAVTRQYTSARVTPVHTLVPYIVDLKKVA